MSKKQDKYEWRKRVHDAEVMGGIRYVRNSGHHDWSDAGQISDAGFAFPMTFPLVSFEWVLWPPARDLSRPQPEAASRLRAVLRGRDARKAGPPLPPRPQ